MEKIEFFEKITKLQNLVKAPKDKFNSFGNFSYRSVENIYEAAKPHLLDLKLNLNLTDDIVFIGDRYYIQATAILTDGVNKIEAKAYAREPNIKKGMDEAQITGSASSYARKYAISALLLLDDNQDIDSQDNTKNNDKSKNDAAALPKNINKNAKVQLFTKLQDFGLEKSEMKNFVEFVKLNVDSENDIFAFFKRDIKNLIDTFKNQKKD